VPRGRSEPRPIVRARNVRDAGNSTKAKPAGWKPALRGSLTAKDGLGSLTRKSSRGNIAAAGAVN